MYGSDDYVRDPRVVAQQWEHRDIVAIVRADGLMVANDPRSARALWPA